MPAGWRIRLVVALARGERWCDSESLTYKQAFSAAQRHANAGRRVRIVDPEGRASQDVPPESKQPKSRATAAELAAPQLEIFSRRRSR